MDIVGSVRYLESANVSSLCYRSLSILCSYLLMFAGCLSHVFEFLSLITELCVYAPPDFSIYLGIFWA